MKLLRLELRHWCQHAELNLAFPDEPIILLSGPNNSGKSNIIRAIGRVLALGRSEFGDATAIQHGAEQASVRLTALTHERLSFTISREIKPRQTRARLEFADKLLSNADEIQAQLQEWFGRQETLLELFIAPQGQIAALIKERGKDRLTNFIEICGFKRFLQKQAALNKFLKKFPNLSDPSPLEQDVSGKLQALVTRMAEKQSALSAGRSAEEMQHEITALQQTRTLRQSTEKELQARQKSLAQAQDEVQRPLPNLDDLQKRLQSARTFLTHCQLAARHQQTEKARQNLAQIQGQLQVLPVDQTNYVQLLQQSGENLQAQITRRNDLTQVRKILAQWRTDLESLETQLAGDKKFLAGLPHSLNWYRLTLEQISELHTAAHRLSALENSLKQKQDALARQQAIPPLSPAALKACQASETRLGDIISLRKHAEQAADQCPLCLQLWDTSARSERRSQLERASLELQADLEASPEATAAHQRWVQAQAEIARLGPEIESESAVCRETRRLLQAQLDQLALPPGELATIPAIVAIYHRVKDALTPRTDQVELLRNKIAAELPVDQARATEEAQLTAAIEQGSSQIRSLLEKQSAAHENATKQARLKQQADTLQGQLSELENGLPPKPDDYQAPADYAQLSREAAEKLQELQGTFQKASQDWTRRFDQLRGVELLKSEIAAASIKLQSLQWGAEQEAKLGTLEKQLQVIQRLGAELELMKQQSGQLELQLADLRIQKQRFERQSRDITDLAAVGDFLSYDNGPLKFLTSFFQEALNQTNLLLSEMEVPVRLLLGKDLDILVEENNACSTSALALGGGYSNLAGIAFRIALQRMILPRVHVLILDEPSTHIDEANMDLLMPFFERLKDNIGRYGIEQCIIIDHHPAWRNTTAAIVHLEARKALHE